MSENNPIQDNVDYVEAYYKALLKTAKIGDLYFSYYKSLRGYFKHSIVLTQIKEENFSGIDYRVWERLLTSIKGSKNPAEAGAIWFRYKYFKDICSKRSFYYCKKKFVDLELLIETPFKDYFILNPKYIIKLFNPAIEENDDIE